MPLPVLAGRYQNQVLEAECTDIDISTGSSLPTSTFRDDQRTLEGTQNEASIRNGYVVSGP